MNDTPHLPTGAEDVVWDLSDLYGGIDDPAIMADMDRADADADRLNATYRGRVAGLNVGELSDLLTGYEGLRDAAERAINYAHLVWNADSNTPAHGALLQRATERLSRLSQKLIFLDLELAAAPDAVASVWQADARLSRAQHWLESLRRYRPHLLSEPEEKILTEKSVTGRSAWGRFFNETHNAARYSLDGKQYTRDQVLTHLYAEDRGERSRAATAVTAGLRELQRPSTFVFNTILADKASDDRLRNYPTWLSARNLSNEVDDSMVDALISAVTGRYDIVARYYRLKRRLLGLDELLDYDRYAPLPASDRHYSWIDARDLVLDAYGQFSPHMREVAGLFFERHWIDAAIRPGKTGGAFSAGVTPSVHPYILMNYDARPRDVMTLAHELGHGIHQKLSTVQGILQADTPLTTAETASVFGEMLVFQSLMAQEKNERARLALLTAKLEDSFATSFRQISLNRFEHAIHTARRDEGELTAVRLGELWLETQRAMFRDSVTISDDYGLWWSYIPHFINTPGYVYAYAFGELLVLALYARYRQVGPSFVEAYLGLLSAGGSDWPHNLVMPLGVDLTDATFWHGGLAILDNMVEEAEHLAG